MATIGVSIKDLNRTLCFGIDYALDVEEHSLVVALQMNVEPIR